MSEEVRYVCIHGHFYQPPRENPWHEELEREPSAAPHHDWNERIAEECYRPNASARVQDVHGNVVDLVNNYQSLSFNFGPTVMRWLQKHQAWTYEEIIAADRASLARTGHGNSIAQVYNHVIMPLASLRDKRTQVRWGIADFAHRFGRKPEGMWLSECAVDDETLGVLADEGIRYTILSPFQAKRFKVSGGEWQSADGGTIPTGRAYRYDPRRETSGGPPIHLFFYDGPLARGIAFDRLLGHSSHLTDAMRAAHTGRRAQPGEPWLVHTATDGESYGHHFKFGDMALAAAFKTLHEDPSTQVTNYAAFLDRVPVRAQAEIHEASAWSCAHGVGRWKEDCGCAIAAREGWTQAWRKPLREGLDLVRDRLAKHYEREMELIADDPWAVRDAYIAVILDPNAADAFWAAHRKPGVEDAAGVKFFQLLEMQRAAMLMYTSCGWFFDDVTGGETVILMKYAARAIDLCARTGGPAIEPDFVAVLEQAKSNHKELGTGKDVYEREAKPAAVDGQRVAVTHALLALARPSHRPSHVAVFDVDAGHEEDLAAASVPTLFGRVQVQDTRTGEGEDHLYAVVHFGGLDFRCSVKPYIGEPDRLRTLDTIKAALSEHSTVSLMRALDDAFGRRFFTLEDALADLRHDVALALSSERLAVFMDFQMHLYEANRPLLFSLQRLGVELPGSLSGVVGRVLSQRASLIVDELVAVGEDAASEPSWRKALSRLDLLREEAKLCGLKLELAPAGGALGEAMEAGLLSLCADFRPEVAAALSRHLDVCRRLSVKPRLWELQTLHHRLVQQTPPDKAALARPLFEELDAFLDCRFVAGGVAGSVRTERARVS